MELWKKRVTDAEAERAITFNTSLPSHLRVNGLHYNGLGVLSMERLVRHPLNWKEVESTVTTMWSHGDDYLTIDLCQYTTYVNNVMMEIDMPFDQRNRVIGVLKRCLQLLTPVKNCHGDCTLGNMMYSRKGHLVFIDPGEHRGLPCREIDIAKLAQSQDGWEEAKGHFVVKQVPRIAFNHAVYALLMTHYIRILRHSEKNNTDAMNFAFHRFTDLLEMLS